MKLKITAVKHYTTNKDSQPLLDKNSRPYTRITIQTAEHPGKWISGLGYQNDAQLNWKIGDEVEADVVPNGQYLNFNLPRANKGNGGGVSPDVVEKLFTKLTRMEEMLIKIGKKVMELNPDEAAPVVEEEIKSEDIPF